MTFTLRTAMMADIPTLNTLIFTSVMIQQANDYGEAPLYRAYDYVPIEATEARMADGLRLEIVRMGKAF